MTEQKLNFKKVSLYSLYYIFLFATIYFVFIGIPFWDGFFYWLWKAIRVFKLAYGYLMFLLLEFCLTVIPIIIYRRKHIKTKTEKTNDIALIIPCHKAGDIIKDTLEAALKVFEPQNIFVIDNGNSSEPLDNTNLICEELGINYKWVSVGSKVAAIYVGAKITKNYKYVMQIDDDVFLNEDMSFPVDENTDCIAYMISADSHRGNKNIIHHLQDMEYKHGGIIRGYQGSPMFAHGAISLWNRLTLINVLENHQMYKISDDWFTGYTCNAMGYNITVCDRNFVKTDVPSNLFFKSRQGGYGNATLFSQRFGRWYRTRIIQMFYTCYYMFFVWKQKLPIYKVFLQKMFFLWDIMQTLLNYSRLFMFVFYVLYDWRFTLILWGACLATGMLNFLILNYYQLQKEERLPFWLIFIAPIYSVYDSVVFCLTLTYSLLTNPFVLFNKDQKLKENDKILKIIEENN